MDWVKVILVLLAIVGVVFFLLMLFPPTRMLLEFLNIKWSLESIGIFNDQKGAL